MTSKKEKLLWLIAAAVLVLLFLMSSTDLIIKEKRTEVYPISVILDDISDDFYINFKKGVEQAAKEYHVDVSFITLYERGEAEQQMDMVTREINDGARAVILSPVEDANVALALDEDQIGSPLILINSELAHTKIFAGISPDYYHAGQLLAEHVAQSTPLEVPVYLIAESTQKRTVSMACDGVNSILGEKGYQVKTFPAPTEENCRQLVENMVYPDQTRAVLIAMDMTSAVRIAQALEESMVYRDYTVGFYGLGSNLQILNYLDREILDGIIVTNDFIQGYISIQKAVEAIRNSGARENITLDCVYIEKEDIRKKEYQKLLYPID